MWQEIVVGVIVVIAAIFVARRIWKSFSGLKSGSTDSCGCGCSNCSSGSPSSPDCPGPGSGQTGRE